MGRTQPAVVTMLLTRWQALGHDAIWQLFIFFALLGTLPALRANSLLPHDWLDRAADGALPALLENSFGILALLPMAATWLLARRLGGGRYILAVWPYLLFMLAGTAIGRVFPGLATLYVLLAGAVLVGFVLKGKVLSPAFGAYLGMLILWQWFDPLLTAGLVLLFALCVVVARLAVEAVRQNLPLVMEIGRHNMRALVSRTLALWWPMLILLGIGLWFSGQLSQRSENLLYEVGFVLPWCSIGGQEEELILVCPPGHQRIEATQWASSEDARVCAYSPPIPLGSAGDRYAPPFRCPTGKDNQDSWPVSRLPLFDNIERTVSHAYNIQRVALREKLQRIDEETDDMRGGAETAASDLFSVVPETTGMSRRHCDFPYVACEAGNLVIGELNRAYKARRAEARKEFVREMGTKAEEFGGDVTQWTTYADGELNATLDTYEDNTLAAIARVHAATNVLQKLLLLWLVFITIKSLLYVFARVIFDRATPIDVDLLERDGEPVEGNVRQVSEVNIPAGYPHDIYYKANYQPLGPAPRFSIPQWRASLLSRLRYGAWNMSHVAMPLEDDSRITFNAIEAEHLVDWELREGEEVIFSYGNFVAMNEHVQLRTVFSLRVATLLLGRMIFHTARCEGGPGRLILRTRGKPATAQQVQQSIPAARLVAWNRYARFSVDSHLTPADIFLNGFNLRRTAAEAEDKPRGILIVEADARDGGILVGTLRFARNFLLPI